MPKLKFAQAKQPFEIQAEEITIEGASAPDYPLQKKRHTLEYLRTMTHLRPPDQYFPGGVPGTFPGSVRYSQVLSGEGVCVCTHTADYRK